MNLSEARFRRSSDSRILAARVCKVLHARPEVSKITRDGAIFGFSSYFSLILIAIAFCLFLAVTAECRVRVEKV